MNVALGWIKPQPQHLARLRFAGSPASAIMSVVSPAEAVDNSSFVSILNQGALGSCTANAIAQMIRAEMLRSGAPPNVEFLARLWAYSLAVAKDGNFGKDVGTHLATVMDMISQHGFPPEIAWPYDIASFGQRPPLDAYHEAIDQRGEETLLYHQIDDDINRLLTIRQVLTSGKLVAFGTQVTEQFCSSSPAELVCKPKYTDKIAGGHALTICGYKMDWNTGRYQFLIANSWGVRWGVNGFFWMDEDYVSWEETCDMWMVSKVPMFS